MIGGEWKTCLIDIDRSSEFTGDDVDQYSKLVNLGRIYDKIMIIVPTIDSSALNLYAQRNDSSATVPTIVHHGYMYDASGAGNVWTTAAWSTTAGTGAYAIECNCVCAQYIRIRATTNQTADRTLYVMGVRG